MTDALIRLSCSETGDFTKLMLAPGLPMLDGKMLTYQVLQGWLHDLLGEPELDGDMVKFHVLVDGQRRHVLSRSFANAADLQGPLAGDFEKLRNALMNVKPVSPSERLIFSRLQPPVDSSEGFLFKAMTDDRVERLVWCWGYQRRVSEGQLVICPQASCSALIIKQGGPSEMCPHCGELLEKPAAVKRVAGTSKRRRPIGAFIAAGTLLCAAAGTYFYAATANRDVPSDEELITGLEAKRLEADERAPQSLTVDVPSPELPGEVSNKPESIAKSDEPRDLFQPEITPERPRTKATKPAAEIADRGSKSGSSKPEVRTQNLPLDLPMPEPPTLQEDVSEKPFVAKTPEVGPAPLSIVPKGKSIPTPKPEKTTEPAPLVPVEPKAVTKNDPLPLTLPEPTKSEPTQPQPLKIDVPNPVVSTPKVTVPTPEKSALPTLPSISLPDVVSPAQPEVADAKPTPSKEATPSKEVVKLTPDIEEKPSDPAVTPTPKKSVGEREWHQDYLAAYQQAIQDKRMLVMLFRDGSNPDSSESRTSGFGAEELQPLLDNYVRVSLPISAIAPGGSATAPSTRLIEHRSFRHLRGQAGIAIVDLTDAQGPNYGRVVSALPLPADGRYSPEVLSNLLQLPTGSVGQRSVVLAVRTGVSGENFTSGEPNSQLAQLANRNARLMAQADQAGSYEQAERVTAIRESFGDGINIGELLFATEGTASVQEAAIQAVTKWMQSPEDRRVLTQPSFAYGIELFQSPNSQRWFATCIVLSR